METLVCTGTELTQNIVLTSKNCWIREEQISCSLFYFTHPNKTNICQIISKLQDDNHDDKDRYDLAVLAEF